MTKQTGLKPEVVVAHACVLGEGPVWDVKRELIYWIDIVKGHIHQYSPTTRIFHTIPVHQMIGSIAVCKNGNLIGAFQNGFGFVEPESGVIKMITDPEEHLPGNRFNEGKCDPAGRFWAGTMSLEEKPHAGSLYMLASDLSVTKKIEGITISNGLAWSLDHKTFYYIDTPTFEVVSYEFDKNTGNISNKKCVIQIPKEDGYPDGMTIDTEGMLWIAHWNGWQVTRWNPITGKKIHRISLPVAKVTSCTFGGDALQDLFITTASIDLNKDEFQKQPLAGSLFVVRHCGFSGVESYEFDR